MTMGFRVEFESDDAEWRFSIESVGRLRAELHGPLVWLRDLDVDPKFRCRGVARQLISDVVRRTHRSGRLLVIRSEAPNVLHYLTRRGFVSGLVENFLVFPVRPRTFNVDIFLIECESSSVNVHPLLGDVYEAARDGNLDDFPAAGYLRSLHTTLDAHLLGGALVSSFIRCAADLDDVDLESRLDSAAWDALNTGHYSDVQPCWRQLYFAIGAVRCWRLEGGGDSHDSHAALEAADRALMMGEPTETSWRNWLAAKADDLNRRLVETDGIEEDAEIASACSLPPQALENSRPVHIFESPPSIEEFCRHFLIDKRPAVIRGAVRDWPALEKWTWTRLERRLRYRTAPVEFGSKYTDDEWSQRLTKIGDFLRSSIAELGAESVHEFDRPPIAYLAQHRLFEQVPELLDDLDVPDYAHCEGDDDVDLNFWMGPAGTVSPLHQDPRHNLFCQVRGRKFVRLAAPDERDKLYPPEDGVHANSSQVDAEAPDLQRFPRFADVELFDCVLDAGDALLIPRAWWHHVRALSSSISVSCWFGE